MSRRRRNRGYGDQGADPDTGFFGGLEMQLRIEGVHGDSDLPGHEGWIPILAWSFGMSRNVEEAKLPARLKKVKAERKKAYFAKHGFDQHGSPLEEESAAAAEPKDGDDAAMVDAAPAKKKMSHEEAREKFEELQDAYDSDAEVEKFEDSEIPPRKLRKANVQDFSMTKYCDVASAQIYQLVLGQKKGVEATLRVLKSRAKKVEGEDEEAEKKKKEAAGKVDTKARGDIFGDGEAKEEEEKEVEREYVIAQQFILQDVFVSSVSTGGSGGEDRLTENITLQFSGLQFTIVDVYAKYAKKDEKKDEKSAAAASSSSSSSSSSSLSTSQPKVFERSIIYDPLRNVVSPYKEAVTTELNKNDQLRPVGSLVLGYL